MGIRQALSSRFSHFASASPAAIALAATAAEDDEEAKRAKAAEEEEARKAEDAEEDKKAKRARKAKKMKKPERSTDDDDDEDGDEAADDDEDEEDDEEMKKAASAGHDFALDAAYRMGARAQRRRCAAILAHPGAATNPVLAMSLAFETSMKAEAAIAVLEKTPAAAAAAPSGLHGRMAGSAAAQARVGAGGAPPPTGAKAAEASWDMIMKDVAPSLR